MSEPIAPTAGTTSRSDPDTQKRRLKESCQEFEAILTGFIFKSMRESVMRSDDPDQAREIYEEMVDQSVATQLSRQKGLGLGDTLYKSLLPLLREQSPSPSSELGPSSERAKT